MTRFYLACQVRECLSTFDNAASLRRHMETVHAKALALDERRKAERQRARRAAGDPYWRRRR